MSQASNDSFPPLPFKINLEASALIPAADGPPGAAPRNPPVSAPIPTSSKLRQGTYVFNWSKTDSFEGPVNLGLLDGTFRFEHMTSDDTIRASGDAYKRAQTFVPGHQIGGVNVGPMWVTGPAPPVDGGIPILPLDQYEGYLRVTRVSPMMVNSRFSIRFEKYRWNAIEKAFATNPNQTAVIEEMYEAWLTWKTAPAGYPSAPEFLTGEVKVKLSGAPAGFIQMGWVSDKWRKIGLEIDAVKGCTFPLLNSAKKTIWSLLEDAGFQVAKQVTDESTVPDTADSTWRDAELHAAMLAHRQTVDLNTEWTYHALVVPQFDQAGVLGLMYDDIVYGSDTNKIAREGFAVAAHLPTGADPRWGTEANKKLQEASDSFVRTTIHELTHAMGIHHPDAYTPQESMDQTYTCQTWSLLDNAHQSGVTYPTNIKWSHSPSVQKRLRHYPDIRIRPGGVAFNQLAGVRGAAPFIAPNDVAPAIPGLRLSIKPLIAEVPIGAPVRIEVTLSNDTEFDLQVPADISLKGMAMKGDVKDSNGMRRPFRPIRECQDIENPFVVLAPGALITTSLTLLAGTEGPLFPSTGVHVINAILSWNMGAMDVWLTSKTTVMVTGARSASHAAAAHRILAEPQSLLTVVLAGDHLEKGVEAVHEAVKDDVLGPHYAYIEARRCANHFMSRMPDLDRARKLMAREGIVMSPSEEKKMEHLLNSA